METRMTTESERRFHSVMDKLFQSPPKSPSSCSSAQSSRGQKRLASEIVEEARKSSSDPPMCRPWDRADLTRRLSTFKSMTWFAKPEAMSALNCARRGWINVDTDTITCEACGSRFLFSTPSAWNRQQVENLAAVFSLKLDKGHKSLCPWIDNVCDEMLSKLPPTPLPALAEKFKERCVALSQLSALPVISSSAIEYVKSPALEEIIEQPLVLEYENGSVDVPRTEYIGEKHDADSARKYYQAQKLIALCGWDPRSLPYVVNSGCKSIPSLEMQNIPNLHNLIASQKEISIDVQSAGIPEQTEANGVPNHSNRPQCNPDSVALDCRLCGASVGLWAFETVPQPMELVRLVGNAEISDKTDQGTNSLGTERRQSLQLTIAGGPPPGQQDFKASISFPVIGRNIRAQFCGDSESGDHRVPGVERAQVETICNTDGKENENNTPLADMDSRKTETKDGLSVDQTEIRATEIDGLDNSSAGDRTSKIGEDGGSELVSMVSPNGGGLLQISGGSEVHGEEPILAGLDGDIDIDVSDLLDYTTSDAILNHQNNEGNLQISADNTITSTNTESDLRRASLDSDKATEFNPIKQHRHFCPWISSMYNATPGWKQTLSALQRQKGFSPLSEKSPSSSIIKVDDPITSVRNLFTSPLKRMKQDLLTGRSTKT